MLIQHLSRLIFLHAMKTICAVLLLSVFAPLLLAEKSSEKEMTNGELAGIIRSADLPCNNVIEFQATSKNAWLVTCNSGVFSVKRGADGNFNVTPSG